MMRDTNFTRAGAFAAPLVGVSSLLYGIVYLALLPKEQAAGVATDVAAFYASFAQNSTPAQITNGLLVLSGIFTTIGVAAIYERLAASGGWARWAIATGFVYGVLTAVHGLWDVTATPIFSACANLLPRTAQ
jgi:hypothetical protein